MSPEQARGKKEVKAASDVFSLGVVMWQCLTGAKPFTGDDAMAVIARILLSDPPRLRDLVADCPPALDELVARMMEKIVKVEESGLSLVICVEVPEPVEFTHEPVERCAGDIGRKSLVSVAANIIERLCGGIELVATRLAEASRDRGRLPFAFVSPGLESWFAAVTASRLFVQQKTGEDAAGDGSGEGSV